MPKQTLYMNSTYLEVHTLSNGLKAVVEPIQSARTVSIILSLDFGSKDDPAHRAGLTSLAASTSLRGFQNWSPRKIQNAFDDLGADRDARATVEQVIFEATTLPRFLEPVIILYGKFLSKPSFPPRQFNVARTLAEESIHDLMDNPIQDILSKTCSRALGSPLGRSPLGKLSTLQQIEVADLRTHWEQFCSTDKLNIVVAGAVKSNEVLNTLEYAFRNWPISSPKKPIQSRFRPRASKKHYARPLHQMHQCITYPVLTPSSPLYYASILAAVVIFGENSGRLITEIREKRGLAYAVNAFRTTFRNGALLSVYTGTTPENAANVLEICLSQINQLNTITQSELERARTMIKGQLLTTGETAESRAATITNELYLTGAPRHLKEIIRQFDQVTLNQVLEYADEFQPNPLTIVSMGDISNC